VRIRYGIKGDVFYKLLIEWYFLAGRLRKDADAHLVKG
jgi:hypothetical protein